jgi:hypothetical protein
VSGKGSPYGTLAPSLALTVRGVRVCGFVMVVRAAPGCPVLGAESAVLGQAVGDSEDAWVESAAVGLICLIAHELLSSMQPSESPVLVCTAGFGSVSRERPIQGSPYGTRVPTRNEKSF